MNENVHILIGLSHTGNVGGKDSNASNNLESSSAKVVILSLIFHILIKLLLPYCNSFFLQLPNIPNLTQDNVPMKSQVATL